MKSRTEKTKPDYILLSVTAILILLGITVLASVSAAFSQEKFGSPTFFIFRHILVGLLPGILLGFAAFKIPLTFLKKWAPALLFINLVLMILVFVPKIGVSFGGASRWIDLGPVLFQPSEFLKLTFIIYLAAWLSARTERRVAEHVKKAFSQTLIAFLIILGFITLLLVFQPDISTLGIIIISAISMYFLAGMPISHSFLITAVGIAGAVFLIKIAPYRFARILTFLNPGIDPMGIGYQVQQALIAIGSGGILGIGLGMSVQEFGLLPQPMSDSIFAIFAEETGFIGSIILVLLFLMFAWRGFVNAKKTQNKFHELICIGLSVWIVLQAFVNIGSMIGIVPLTGIPLPFISHGGSSLIAALIGVGILLNISKSSNHLII